MIDFSRQGTKVRCTVSVRIPYYDARDFYFEWETGKEYAAGLLAAHMEKEYFDEVKKSRHEAYERGWKDAKAKRAKYNW